MAGKTNTKRKDNNRTVLRKGETQRKDGSYDFRWTDPTGKRHSVYAKTLTELREKEKMIDRDISDGIMHDGNTMTIDDLFELWFSLKRGVRDSTLQTYKYAYKYGISPYLGQILIKNLAASHVKRAYIKMLETNSKSIDTIKTIHQVLMQALDFAVDDRLLRNNPAKKVYSEFRKEAEDNKSKKIAMTSEEQSLLLDFISSNNYYKKWENLIVILNGTGMRIGEALALQWSDIDYDKRVINIDKTLIYMKNKDKTEFSIHPPKTKTSIRQIPMSSIVANAFFSEREYQKEKGIVCIDTVDGYNDFVFLSHSGKARSNIDVNASIKRIVASYNKKALFSEEPIFLPDISCHTFRHNFATRLFECGVEPKVVQSYLGHSSISITMNIYTDFFLGSMQDRISPIDQFLTPKFTPIET